MSSDAEPVDVAVLQEAPLDDLRPLETVLLEAEIPCQIVVPPPEHCKTCGNRLWIVVPKDRAIEARGVLEQYWDQELDPTARRSVGTIVNLDADEATCPGCLTTFPAGESRCPECGLNFGGS